MQFLNVGYAWDSILGEKSRWLEEILVYWGGAEVGFESQTSPRHAVHIFEAMTSAHSHSTNK